MAASADAVIGAAASQIGYYAKPGSTSKFGSWYGIPTGQWCAMFVSWAADQVGALDIIPKHAYTPSGAQWFRDHGQWHTGSEGIRRGDLVYFDFPGEPNRISHVGIVEKVNGDGSFQTIEGNTSGTVNGDQRNGGLVARKTRKGYVSGYGRPAYVTLPKPSAPKNADGSLTIAEDGSRGPQTISRWQEVHGTPIDGSISKPFSSCIKADQQMLNAVVDHVHILNLTGRSTLAEDGDEGPKTIKVRQFLLWNKWSQEVFGRAARTSDFDGINGPNTNRLHQHALNRATRGTQRY